MLQRSFVAAIAALVIIAGSPAAAQSSDERTIEEIRSALSRLPYYGVFDFLAFRYEQGTVTLSGYAYRPRLKEEAISAVKRVSRVDEVIDEIEALPVSLNDDRIRWDTFSSIYDHAFLSRYAPGGGMPVRFERQFTMFRFPGMQPFGMYPIHIIVQNGRTLLAGVVDSEADKTVAGFRARQVPGTFGVENELVAPAPRARR